LQNGCSLNRHWHRGAVAKRVAAVCLFKSICAYDLK
jgi:hypothetical protein